MKTISLIILLFAILELCNSTASNIITNYKLSAINIKGNKTTKNSIIFKELDFNIGDSLSIESLSLKIEQSKINLQNLSLFNFIYIDYTIEENKQVTIEIRIEERWYTWPSLSLDYADRNFSAWLKNGEISKTNYGFSIDRYNFRGLNEDIKFMLTLGYAEQFMLAYQNRAIDNDKKHLLGIDISLTQQNEVIYKTENNKPVSNKNKFETVYKEKKLTINYSYRANIFTFHKLYVNFIKYEITEELLKLNPRFLVSGTNNSSIIAIDYNFSIDRRDSRSYPLDGYLFELAYNNSVSTQKISKHGFYISLFPSFYKFNKIGSKLFYAVGCNLKLSTASDYSYQYSKALGYHYNLHGFEYNVIDGDGFVLLKNILKINILPTKISTLKFIPLNKFKKINYAIYLNLFTDFGYVKNGNTDMSNNYSNQYLYGYGLGIDIVTYYDRTLRLDYSLNRFGYSGLYISFSAPINR